MTLNKKSLSTFIACLLLGMLIGSLGWEVLERILHHFGVTASLTLTEPIQLFDLYVLSLSFRANPGTFLGAGAGALIFKWI